MYINCCVRKESRTEKLANAVLEKMKDVIEEVKAYEIDYPVVNEIFLLKRDSLIAKAEWDDSIFLILQGSLQKRTRWLLPRRIGICHFQLR